MDKLLKMTAKVTVLYPWKNVETSKAKMPRTIYYGIILSLNSNVY